MLQCQLILAAARLRDRDPRPTGQHLYAVFTRAVSLVPPSQTDPSLCFSVQKRQAAVRPAGRRECLDGDLQPLPALAETPGPPSGQQRKKVVF